MIDNDIAFYNREKLKFNELLSKIQWTEDSLLTEQEKHVQSEIDRERRLFSSQSKYVQECRLGNERFTKRNVNGLTKCEQEKQFNISASSSQTGNTIHQPREITKNLPLITEETTILQSLYGHFFNTKTARHEDLNRDRETSLTHPTNENKSASPQNSKFFDQLNELAELRDKKRRRAKYVTPAIRKSFYDIAREMIDNGMKAIEKVNYSTASHQINDKKDQTKHVKHKHRSSSKRKHRSSHSHSREHRRHKKKKIRKS